MEAGELVIKAFAEAFTEANKKVDLELSEEDLIFLQIQDPQILTLVLEVEKNLNLAEEISLADYRVKPSVKINAGAAEGPGTVEGLNALTNNVVYNNLNGYKSTVTTRTAKLNEAIKEGQHSYKKAVSPEDVLILVCQEKNMINPNIKDSVTRETLYTHLTDTYEEMKKAEEGTTIQTLPSTIFDDVSEKVKPLTVEHGEGDHAIRATLRRGLDQRSVQTKAKDDTGQAICIPEEVCDEKEKMSFAEPVECNYKTGLAFFLEVLQKRANATFPNMSSSARKNLSALDYNNSYDRAYALKLQEMKTKYPGVSDSYRYKIYHANLISGSNETRLELWNNNFRNNSTLESSSINKKGLKTPEGQIYVKAIVKMRDLAKVECEHSLGLLDLLTETSSSPQAKEQLGMIKEQSWYQSKALIISIDNKISNLTDLPLDNELTIENLTSTLFDSVEKSKDTLTEDEQNVIVYNFMKEEKITDVGKGFPINSLFYNLQNIEREFNSPNAEVRKQAIDRLNEVNDNIDKALDRSPLISLPDMVLASEEAFQFHSYLKAQGVPTSLADLIVKKANINNLEDLLAKVEDNSILDVASIGPGKSNQLKKLLIKPPIEVPDFVSATFSNTQVGPGLKAEEPESSSSGSQSPSVYGIAQNREKVSSQNTVQKSAPKEGLQPRITGVDSTKPSGSKVEKQPDKTLCFFKCFLKHFICFSRTQLFYFFLFT